MWQLDWSKLAEVLTYNAKQPMIFSSGLFLFLFLGFSLIYMLLQKKDTARILFVTLFSYYFYFLNCLIKMLFCDHDAKIQQGKTTEVL